jgi:hydrogenase maturation protease
MTHSPGNVLLIGYGNPGRRDDGLGPALAAAIDQLGFEWVTAESCYQLAVEHAEQVARHDLAIFADAAVAGPEPFRFDRLDGMIDAAFSTHRVAPETILGLAHTVFHAATDGYVLAIRGYDFDGFGEALSAQARDNLATAVEFLRVALQALKCEVRR